MTDKAWEIVIKSAVSTFTSYLEFLRIAEEEYERRYGHSPSEVDDDWWIDLLHQGQGRVDIKQIKENAEMHR